MPDEGYLQSKIRQNQEKLINLENKLNECSTALRILKENTNKNQARMNEIYNKIKETAEHLDPNQLKRNINMITNEAISKQYVKISKKLDKKLNTMMKRIQDSKATNWEELLGEVGNTVVNHTNIFFQAFGNILISFHDVLLKTGIVDKSFGQVTSWHADPNSIDRIIIIDFEHSKLKILLGKNRLRKWARSHELNPDDGGHTKKLDIKGKPNGIIESKRVMKNGKNNEFTIEIGVKNKGS